MFTTGNEEIVYGEKKCILSMTGKPLGFHRESHVIQIDKYDIFTEIFNINIVLVENLGFWTL